MALQDRLDAFKADFIAGKLGFKPTPRLEQIDDEHSERVQDCEHSITIMPRFYLAMRIPTRMEFSERTGERIARLGPSSVP